MSLGRKTSSYWKQSPHQRPFFQKHRSYSSESNLAHPLFFPRNAAPGQHLQITSAMLGLHLGAKCRKDRSSSTNGKYATSLCCISCLIAARIVARFSRKCPRRDNPLSFKIFDSRNVM